MSDLVERLYQMSACGLQGYHDPQICAVLREAQEEITRLVGQVEEAKKHLRSIASQCSNVIYNCEQRPADNTLHLNSWRSVKEYAEAAQSISSTVGEPK